MVSAAGEYLSDAGRQIQIADLIDEVTDGERVNVYAEDSLLYGIREYNANICLVTEGERGYLYHIITEDDPNASGNLSLEYWSMPKLIILRSEKNIQEPK